MTTNQINSTAFAWQAEAGRIIRDTDDNLLVLTPTGTGKTEAAILAFERYGCGMLVEHTRAACYEMHRRLQERLEPLGLRVRIGNKDYSLGKKAVSKEKADIFVVSVFKLEQLLTQLGADFAKHIPVVVLDELHQFGELEGVTTLLRKLCPDVRLIGLSATITEDDRAKLTHWLGTKTIHSEDRPVPIVERIVRFEQDFGNDDEVVTTVSVREVGKPGEQQVAKLGELDMDDHVLAINDIIVKNPEERGPAMVWVPYRQRADRIAEKFLERRNSRPVEPHPQLARRIGSLPDGGSETTELLKRCLPQRIGIHHGGMTKLEQELVYDLAADRQIDILIGCRTLTQSVNLPWRHVIVSSIYDQLGDDGGEPQLISPTFFRQLEGRCGRPGLDTMGRMWIPSHSAVDLAQIEEVLLLVKAGAIVSRMSDERFLERKLPVLVKVGFDTVAKLVEYMKSTFWAMVLTDVTPIIEQFSRIIRYLVAEGVMIEFDGSLLLLERGSKLASLGVHPAEFKAIERLTAAKSLNYEEWIDGLCRAVLGDKITDEHITAMENVRDLGLTVYAAKGVGRHSRELADQVQRLLEISESYLEIERCRVDFGRPWREAVLERFTLGKLELARKLSAHLDRADVRRLVRNLGGILGFQASELTEEHHRVIAQCLYGDLPEFRFGSEARKVGEVLGLDAQAWMRIIINERIRRE